jgi:hypothetical protein
MVLRGPKLRALQCDASRDVVRVQADGLRVFDDRDVEVLTALRLGAAAQRRRRGAAGYQDGRGDEPQRTFTDERKR